MCMDYLSGLLLSVIHLSMNLCVCFQLLYKLSGGFERDSVELLVNYAYTGHLEVPDSLVRNVYVVAKRLKVQLSLL